MTDHRIGPPLYVDVLDVLHRHGFADGDIEHQGRAISLIKDLARTCEGTQDHQPSPPAARRPPGRHPGHPAPGSRDAAVIPASSLKTVLIALDLAAGDIRDRAEICTGCPGQSCPACQTRLHDAQAHDQLADRMSTPPKPPTMARPASPARQSGPAPGN
jgi:hypothetical protein